MDSATTLDEIVAFAQRQGKPVDRRSAAFTIGCVRAVHRVDALCFVFFFVVVRLLPSNVIVAGTSPGKHSARRSK